MNLTHLLLVACVVAASNPSLAAPPSPAAGSDDQQRPPDPAAIIGDNATALGIDDVLVAEIQALFDDAATALEAQHAEARRLRDAGELDASRAAHQAARLAEDSLMDDVMSLLSAEQQAGLEALLPRPPGPHPKRGGGRE
jgi:hypothetical protein